MIGRGLVAGEFNPELYREMLLAAGDATRYADGVTTRDATGDIARDSTGVSAGDTDAASGFLPPPQSVTGCPDRHDAIGMMIVGML